MAIRSETPSISSAVEHVIESGQRLLADRIELLRLEVKEDAFHAGQGVAFVIVAMVLGFYGWLALLWLVVYLLWGTVPLGLAIGAVATAHLGGAIYLGWRGAATLQAIRPLRPDDPAVERQTEHMLERARKGT